MANSLAFPASPTTGAQYTAPSGTLYEFDGDKWVGQVPAAATAGVVTGTAAQDYQVSATAQQQEAAVER